MRQRGHRHKSQLETRSRLGIDARHERYVEASLPKPRDFVFDAPADTKFSKRFKVALKTGAVILGLAVPVGVIHLSSQVESAQNDQSNQVYCDLAREHAANPSAPNPADTMTPPIEGC